MLEITIYIQFALVMTLLKIVDWDIKHQNKQNHSALIYSLNMVGILFTIDLKLVYQLNSCRHTASLKIEYLKDLRFLDF